MYFSPNLGVMLVGNKFDLKEEGNGVTKQQVESYLNKHPRWGYMECSAKLDWNVKEMFGKVARMVRDSEKERERQAQSTKMKIHPSKLRKGREGGSCC